MPGQWVEQARQSFGDPTTRYIKQRMEKERSELETRQSGNHWDSVRANNELFCAFNINVMKTETVSQRFRNRFADVKVNG